MALAKPRRKKLTPKQERFVKLYPIYLNGKRAAEDAGYSPKSASVIAHELLNDPRYAHVQQAIQEEMERINKRLEVTQDRIRQELARIAFANIGDFADWDGERLVVKPKESVDPLEWPVIQKLKQTKYGVELELHNKQPALEALARIEGMYKDSLSLKSDGLLLRVAGCDPEELVDLDAEEDA